MSPRSHAWLLVVAGTAGFTASCSSTPVDGPPPDAGNSIVDALPDGPAMPDTSQPKDDAPDVADRPDSDAAPPDTPVTTCVPGHVWKPTSTHFELTSFGFFQGSSGYANDRSAMTDVELFALDQLCVIPTPIGPGGTDLVTYRLKVTDADGSTATYRAAQLNDSEYGEVLDASSTQTVDVNTLAPFLSTTHCLAARQAEGVRFVPPTDAGDDASDAADGSDAADNDAGPDGGQRSDDAGDAAPEPWSKAPIVSAEKSGCLNGVFTAFACSDIWLKLKVERAGEYELRTPECRANTTIRVLSADGSTELASASGDPPACARLSYRFDQPGTYPIDLRKMLAAGCNTNNGGDFFFSVRRQESDGGDR